MAHRIPPGSWSDKKSLSLKEGFEVTVGALLAMVYRECLE